MVIAVCDHYLGQAPDVLVRASYPFGGGVASSYEEMCGVLSGSIMALGALWGRPGTDGDPDSYDLARQFREWFQGVHGTTCCDPIRELANRLGTGCLPVVLQGTRALVELIEATRREASSERR